MKWVRNLDHVAVTVSDLDRSLRFYVDLLGFQEMERHLLEGETISKMAGKESVVMQVVRLGIPETPNILVDLQQYIEPPGEVSNAVLGMANQGHFCFGVTDLDQAYRELSANGVEFVSEPVVFDLGDEWEYGAIKVVFFKDPDGFVLELVEFTK